MEPVAAPRHKLPSGRMPNLGWRTGSIILVVIAVVLLSLVLRAKFQGAEISRFLVIVVAAAFGTVILLGTAFLVRALQEHRAKPRSVSADGKQHPGNLLDDR